MSTLLSNRTALITGGAQGIGLAVARVMHAHGANVVLADVAAPEAAAAAEALGDRALGAGCNVTDGRDVELVVERAVEKFGALDIMVNNAGITRDATLAKMSESQFTEVLEVNLKGVWLGIKMAAAAMKESGGGSIINMSSISGKVGFFGQTNYSAAKAGVVGLTKAAAKELARYEIRVNAIQPGLIETPMTQVLSEEIMLEKIREIPMGRPGQPDEVANVALFLASGLSSYMTGTVLEVTGGRYM